MPSLGANRWYDNGVKLEGIRFLGNKKIIVCQAKKELNYTWKFQCTGLSKIKEKNKGGYPQNIKKQCKIINGQTKRSIKKKSIKSSTLPHESIYF